MTPKPTDRAVIAATASGWIEENAPPQYQDLLLDGVDSWLAKEAVPAAGLWLTIAQFFRAGCLRDPEVLACQFAIGLLPEQAYFRFRLAETLYLSGKDDEARAQLDALKAQGYQSDESHLLRLSLAGDRKDELAQLIPEVQDGLLKAKQWSRHHSQFIRLLVEQGFRDQAAAFLRQGLGTIGVAPDQLLVTAWLAMHTGEYQAAKTLFLPQWGSQNPMMELVIGRFSGRIEPYSPEIEASLRDRIDSAFAASTLGHPRMPVPEAPPLPPGLTAVVVSFGHRDLPNDMAYHFVQLGRAAGIDMATYLDSAITLTQDFRGTDEEVETRVQAFEAEMERIAPHLVILDWTDGGYLHRGLTPERVASLRKKMDFRFVCSVRDSRTDLQALIQPWLAVSDAVIIYNPISDAIGSDPRIINLPSPCIYGPPRPHGHRDTGLVFLGAVNFPLRYALLSVLLTEDIPFTALFGEARTQQAPDMESYLRVLGRSQAMLNISAHAFDHHLITGRVWETINAGGLLVEQANPATPCVLIPYRHYLPWETVDDIIHIAYFIKANPHMAARIADEAQGWVNQHFNAHRFWAALVDRAFTPASPPPACN